MDQPINSFSITIRIKTNQITFNIHVNDNQDALFNKLKKLHPQCGTKKEEVLNKLKINLINKLKNNSIKPELQVIIQSYLKKTFPDINNKEQANHIDQPTSKETTDPYNQLINKQSEKKEKINPKPLIENNFPQQFKRSSNQQKQARQLFNIKQQTKTARQSLSQPKKEIPKEDIVKACQTIFQKSKQKDMKTMARQYLQQIGKLPEQRKPQILISSQSSELQPCVGSSSPKIEQKPQLLSLNQSLEIRSPIEEINQKTQKKTQNQEMNIQNNSLDLRYKYREQRPSRFRGNKYNYLASLESSFEQLNLSYSKQSQTYLKDITNQTRRFSYVTNL